MNVDVAGAGPVGSRRTSPGQRSTREHAPDVQLFEAINECSRTAGA